METRHAARVPATTVRVIRRLPTKLFRISYRRTPDLTVAGSRVGPYTVIGPLGRGGMGEVWLAHDERLQRNVALKRLLTEEGSSRSRILHEARAAARISHPNIATVHDVIELESHAFIVMEYVEGESLASRLGRGRLPAPEVVAIGRQLADGLAAAHAHGVVHRDLKPSNIQITLAGSIKILDFGVARTTVAPAAVASATTTTTSSGDRPYAGTPPYMSPEQLLARTVDHRSDLYSLGVVMYEMAVGRRPFSEHQVLDLVLAMSHTTATPPHSIEPSVPVWLSHLIQNLLARDPAQRFQSAEEVADALRREAGVVDRADVRRGSESRA